MTLSSTTPFFSVVIPFHNRLALVKRSVATVLSQSYGDFELIVVDDGSTEGQIASAVDMRDNRIRLIRQPNRGAAQARTTGVANARGRWIAFLDSDDVWKDSHLEVLLHLIQQFPRAGMVSTKFLEAADDRWVFRWPSRRIRRPELLDYLLEASRRNKFLNTSSVAIQREIVEAVGSFIPVKSGEDLEYWARVAIQTPVAISHQITVAYLRSNGGTMETLATKYKRLKVDAPKTVEDLSPSIRFLSRALELNEIGISKKSSVEHYINAGIDSSILGSIYRGDGHISHLRNLYVSGWTQYLSVVRVVAFLPSSLHRMLNWAWRLGSLSKQNVKKLMPDLP